jgi:transposase-like protein
MPKADETRRQEMFKKVEAYYQSGLSQPAFCKEQGINKSTFIYWLKKYRKEKQFDFVPLPTQISTSTFNIELELPNGIKLRIEG